MHTRLLMSASAAFLLALGLLATFAPQQLLARVGSSPQPALDLVVQLSRSLYLGFAALNWMAKDSLIGGIYSRPVAIGNLFHFFIGAMSLLKALAAGRHQPGVLLAALPYTIFAAWFALVVFRSPVRSLHPR